MLKTMPLRLWDFMHFLSRGGSWRLLAHEKQIVDAVLAKLPLDDARTIRAQLSRGFFVERTPGGRINIIRYYENVGDVVGAQNLMHALFKVQIEINGSRDQANVKFHKGRLFSIELSQSRRVFKGKRIEVCDVSRGREADSYTSGIDRASHSHSDVLGETEHDEK